MVDMDTDNVSDTPVVITYGNMDGDLRVLVVQDLATAKLVATQFVNVIPDDPEDYYRMITAWTGKTPLGFTHQDDDCFFFNAVMTSGTFGVPVSDQSAFKEWVYANT
jgi:hypothetical protein